MVMMITIGIHIITISRKAIITINRIAMGDILAIFYPPLKQIWGCVWLFLQAQEGNAYFTEQAERVEYGNYETYNDNYIDVIQLIVILILLNIYSDKQLPAEAKYYTIYRAPCVLPSPYARYTILHDTILYYNLLYHICYTISYYTICIYIYIYIYIYMVYKSLSRNNLLLRRGCAGRSRNATQYIYNTM